MNKKIEPFLAHSELTDCIYIIDKDDKYEVTEQCIKAMKATNRMPRWIPVSERLPEEDGLYLISTCMNCIDTCLFYKDDDEYVWVDYEDSVRAWMPLPQPYKAESKDEV